MTAETAPKYRGGCMKGMPRIGACRRDCLHRAMVLEYRDTRDAWERLRESDTVIDGAVGAAGAQVAAYQLEDDEFRRLHPPPTFKAWLIDHARTDDAREDMSA